MADLEHGFRPPNPNEEPPTGSEGEAQAKPQDIDPALTPISFPGEGHYTPDDAFGGIQDHEQADAREQVETSRTDSAPESIFTRLRRSTLAKVGTAALALGLTAGGVAKALDNDSPAPAPQNTTSAPATTGPSNEVSPTPTQTTEAPSPSATETENPTETGMSAETVAIIDGESYGEFAERPYAEQVQYGAAKVKLLSEEGYLADFVDQETANNNSLANYNFIDNPTTEISTMEVPLQNLYINQIILAWKKTNPEPGDGAGLAERGDGNVDQVMAKKLASLYAVPGTDDYKGMIETINNKDKKTGKPQELLSGRIDDGDGSKDEKGHTDVKAYYGKEIMRPLYQGTIEIDGKPTTLKMKDYLVHTDAGDKVITYAAVPIGNGNVVWPEVKTVNPSEYTTK